MFKTKKFPKGRNSYGEHQQGNCKKKNKECSFVGIDKNRKEASGF